MNTEGYEERFGADSSEEWTEARKQMDGRQYAASWQRGIEYRNISPEDRDLLKVTDLKLEIKPQKFVPNEGASDVITISGEAEGKKISITRETALRKGSALDFANNYDVDGKKVLVPRSFPDIVPSIDDIYSGEVDGVAVDPETAKEFWVKYARVAAVASTDQALADFTNNPEQQ
jgi:hypothetical protein